jgi:glycosyltransferase involved in cell wall biosynthesis
LELYTNGLYLYFGSKSLMKILLVHNSYGKFSGEEAVVKDIKSLLKTNNHEVISFERSSAELSGTKLGAIKGFICGIYNPFSRRKFRELLESEQPDVIHIHNLFPLISPSILPEASRLGIPIVMTVHNYRLDCPDGLYYSQGEVCERCHGGKEYWCVLRNCEQNHLKSLGYALRNWIARVSSAYLDNITTYACLTEFQKKKLISAGYPADRITIIPNMVQMPDEPGLDEGESYVGFVGRLSKEKGISVLVDSARICADIPFAAAGSYDTLPSLEHSVPDNFALLGHCGPADLARVYLSSRFIVLPSVCYEGFPTVLVEAMLHEKAIICSNIGGLPDIVDDGVTGLLVEPGKPKDLADKIRYLWDHPDVCREMGQAGRKKALQEYSEQKYYERLMNLYKKVLDK